MTHSSSSPVSSVTVVWRPPDRPGQVRLRWSVVQDYTNYWAGLLSDSLTVTRRQVTSLQPSLQPSLPPASSSSRTPVPDKASHLVYSGCDVTKTCYGLPSECQDWNDCDLMLAWQVGGNTTILEMYRRDMADKVDNVYVALGLSEDTRMGDDLVTSCVSHSGRVTVTSSWNSGHSNLPMGEKLSQVELLQGSHVEGELYCRVRLDNYIGGRPPLAGSRHFHYELDRHAYHVLLAGGQSLPGGAVTYHGPRQAQASADLLQLARLSHVHTKFELLLKSHAVVMVVAWLGCAGSGIILARQGLTVF